MVLRGSQIWYDELLPIHPKEPPLKDLPNASKEPEFKLRKHCRTCCKIEDDSEKESFYLFNGAVQLSTPSPSATANGRKVDVEIEKFRSLSEHVLRDREREESVSSVYGLRSRTPSPLRTRKKAQPVSRSKSQPDSWRYLRKFNWRDNKTSCPVHTHPTYKRYKRDSPIPIKKYVREIPIIPAPLNFSDSTKRFRSISSERDQGYDSFSSRSPSPKESSFPPGILRRKSKYDTEYTDSYVRSLSPIRSPSPTLERVRSISPEAYPPVACSYRRAPDLQNKENIFRSRTLSPKRTPESDYRKSYEHSRGTSLTRNRNTENTSHSMFKSRGYSEEPPKDRKPLGDLHEDNVYRRYSDDLRKTLDASILLNDNPDSFIVGDRVWVGGTKPGSISFIGETKFAAGDWAGVTLDEPIGKNDGMVSGVRYFQCEPKKGVFCRLTRLSRVNLEGELPVIHQPRCSLYGERTPSPSRSYRSSSVEKRSESVEKERSKSPTLRKSPSPSIASSVKRTSHALNTSTSINTDLRVGDRVVIDSTTGTKYGQVKYLGRTDFANGIWAGVELDQAVGKNDGSVAGKRYFSCKSQFGIFAPVNRVRIAGGRVTRTPIRRTNSRESLASLGATSVSSSVFSASKVPTRRASGRPSFSSSTVATKALQGYEYYYSEHYDYFY